MIAAIIIGGTILEVSTMCKSFMIKAMGSTKTISVLGNNGYKLSKDAITDFNENTGLVINIYEHKLTKKEKIINVINDILFFVPFANMLSAKIDNIRKCNEIVRTAHNNSKLVPMDENEMYYYKFLISDEQKLNYIINVSQIEDNQELQGIDEYGDAVIAQMDCAFLEYEPLPYISYTKEETEKIIASTPGKHEYCNIGGRNICIIDIPDIGDWENISRVRFGHLNDENSYSINKISDEEAKGTFIIYPLNHSFEELPETIKCYNDICSERNKKSKEKYNSYHTNQEVEFENNFTLKRKLH